MINRNAIILAAGKSYNFAPFIYEKPKGLFCVKGEVLIERQIKQLIDANVKDIYIVVGYMKEKFFYLEQKYPAVHLISNNKFDRYGNIYSLYVARKYLRNTYVCCADHYFVENPFIEDSFNEVSYRACSYQSGKFKEFSVTISNEDIITDVKVGGCDSYAMVGHAYFNENFSLNIKSLLEEEIDDFGIAQMFWEEFFAKHINKLTLKSKQYVENQMIEFDDIEDLRRFDGDFLRNIDSDIVEHICETLKCDGNAIQDISVLNAGLTNVSFAFTVNKNKYVYRHPGGTAINLVDRDTECIAQKLAKEIGVDDSFIQISSAGWKLSYYIDGAAECDLKQNEPQMKKSFDILHMLHRQNMKEDVKVFDNIEEGKRLLKLASATKGNLEREFSNVISKGEKLYYLIQQRAEELGIEKVLCHNDVYSPNFICDKNGKIYLIDWEYAGLNYAANDVGTILCRTDWTDEQVENILKIYLGSHVSREVYIFYKAFIPVSAFYWFCWGLYKGSVGDDDSFFFLPSYRNFIRFIDIAIKDLEVK